MLLPINLLGLLCRAHCGNLVDLWNPPVLLEMTFRGLGIWDLEIMTRVGVRKLGEIDGLKKSSQGWVEERAQRHQRTGRAQKERGSGFMGTH